MAKSFFKNLLKKRSPAKKQKADFHKEKVSTAYNPSRDWKRLLITLVVAVLLILVANTFFFLNLSKVQKTQVDGQATQKINRSKLDSVLDQYDEKEKRFDELLLGKPTIDDPSR